MPETLILQTERPDVILRELSSIEDDIAYFESVDANREHLSQFDDETARKYSKREDVTRARLDPANADRTRMGIWATGDDGEQTFVGSINLSPREDDDGEIGYWLDARQQGHGYATVAVKALAAHAAKNHERVYAEVVEENGKSAAVLERAGARYTERYIKEKVGRLVFDFGGINPLLETGEYAEFAPTQRGSESWAMGYTIAGIRNNRRTEGDSVVLALEPRGASEPVLITNDIRLNVRSLRGSGHLVRWNAITGGDVEIIDMEQDDVPIVLSKGDAYYYLNPHDKELLVRDDCTPFFQEADEIGLTAAPPQAENAADGRITKLPPAFLFGFIQLNPPKLS